MKHFLSSALLIGTGTSGKKSKRGKKHKKTDQEQMSRLSESLSEFNIPLFILHLEQRSDTMNLAYQSGLERIATASGGRALFCRTNDEIAPALGRLLARIESAYVIGFDPPSSKNRSAKLRVEAMDVAGKSFSRVSHIEQVNFGGK